MATYSSSDLAGTFATFAAHMENQINLLEVVDDLPLVGVKREILARQKALRVLRPIHAQFAAAAQQYAEEAEGSMAVSYQNDDRPARTMPW